MNLYAVVLGIIVLVLLTVSISQIRNVKTKADYLVAGRSLPWYVLVFTLLSSWIGSGSLFGGAENAFRNGFAALWQPAGGWLGLLVIVFIAPRARKFAQFTIPDVLASDNLGNSSHMAVSTALTSGFGTTFSEDLALWKALEMVPSRLEWPAARVCIGVSRKRFLAWRAGTPELPPVARDGLTAAAHREAQAWGYRIFRTHAIPPRDTLGA